MARVRECGRLGVLPGGSVRVRATGSGDARRAGFSGLSTCGSVWACPVCAEKILARRSDEVRRALTTWTGLGGRVGFLTFTMRHRKGQPLAKLWDALTYAWGSVTSGRQWVADGERYGIDGWLRVVETTHGANGWHVHVHAAVMLPTGTTADDVDRLHARMVGRWSAALRRRGLSASTVGQHSKLWDMGDVVSESSDLADYFTKADYSAPSSSTRSSTTSGVDRAAMELTRSDMKSGRGGNRTPFGILGDLVELGDADDLDLWSEWEAASKGRRQVGWSKGLRARLLDSPEQSDEEVAAEELGSADDDLVEIPADGWRLVTLFGITAFVLDAAEVDDRGATLRQYLTKRGVPWREVSPVRGMERNPVGA